jgi:outer membrane receptor protein involved in Fe transport
MRKKNITHFSYLSLLSALVAGLPSYANADEETLLEEVVVTGSRIKSNANSAQPVTSFSAEELNYGGQGDIAEILNDNPALLSSVTAANSLDQGANNLGDAEVNNIGGSALDLRGLGTERTLTLVNGRRHVAGIEGTAAVDISSIPTGLIERVEVLSGGASAVYGSDALTGVVNFILKEDYEGFEITAQGGTADSSYGTEKVTALGGLNFAEGRGNVTVSVQYESNDGLVSGDRDFLANNNLFNDDQNPALRFQTGEITAGATPNLAQFYDFATTGRFNSGFRIPSEADFISDYTAEFGTAPTLTAAEQALFTRAATAPPRAILPGRTFNITSPYGVVAAGDFGVEVPLGSEPDLDGNGVSDCLQSFTGYNSSLDGQGFGIAGGCWVIGANGSVNPYTDGLVAGSFNHFGATDSYINPNGYQIIPSKEQYSIDVNGHFDMTDSMTAFWESKYVKVESEAVEAGHNFTDLLFGAPDNPFLPAELAALANNSGLGFGGIDGGLHISRDSDDWSKNLTTNEREIYRLVAGIEGEFNDIAYEVSVNYGHFERNMIDRDEVMLDRFFAAIDAVTDPNTGEIVCRSDLDPTAYPRSTPFDIPQYVGNGVRSSFFTFQPGDGQCAPMNIWGGRGAMSQASVDFVTQDRKVNESMEQFVISAFASGDSANYFELPGGPLAYVVGFEYRKEETEQNFGALDQGILPVSGVTSDGQAFSAGDLVGSVSDARRLIGTTANIRLLSGSSDYDFTDYYVEVSAPVLSGVTGAEELTLEGAFRQSDNSEFGKNDTYKLGVVYAPIQDVQFRYTYSEATRVPNLFELFSPEQGTRFRPADPCDAINIGTAVDPALREANCIADLQANGVQNSTIFDANGNYAFEDPLSAGFAGAVGGNPGLEPETAETESIGIILTPQFVPGLTLSIDLITIDIEDAIVSVSEQNIVDQCYDAASLNNNFCALISRDDDPTSTQSGGLDFVRQVQLNFGAAEYEGIDYIVSYDFNIADFSFLASLNYTDVKTLQFIEGGTVDDELGEMRRPERSGTFSLNGTYGDASITWTTAYLSQQTLTYEDGIEIETALANYGEAAFTDDDTYIHDIRGSYAWDETLTFFGGVNNITDEEPFSSERAYPVSPVGRYAYLGLTYKMF